MISGVANKKLKVRDQKPTCAVLIAVHDGQKYLEQQLKTIISQVGVNTQIFFSDDASTDNTIQLVEKYGGTNLNIDKKKFGSAALNFFGLIKNFDLNQNFDYIFLCDQDDIWFPNKMLRAINCMEQSNTVAYSSSYYSWYEKKHKLNYVNKSYIQNDIDFLFRGPGPGFTFCFESDFFIQVKKRLMAGESFWGFFRWHDWPLYAITRSLGQNWFIDEKPMALYRQHSENDTGQLDSLKALRKRLYFLLGGEFRKQIINLQYFGINHGFLSRISRFSIKDRIFLLLRIRKMRTKLLDRIALLLFLVIGK
jgi:rhamnosyltransferase